MRLRTEHRVEVLRNSLGRARASTLGTLAATIVAAPLMSACHSTATRAEIDDVLQDYARAYNAHDARALAEVHTHDGRYATADGPLVEGRDALAAFWSRSAGSGLVLELQAFETSGAVGWALGAWSGQGPAGQAPPHGRFVLALRREDGRWKIAVDINNEAR